MKEKYETPACEVIEFETEDVITASGGQSGVGEGGIDISQKSLADSLRGGSDPAPMFERKTK